VNHDFASYHVPVNADVEDVEAVWIEENDPRVNPIGAKGVGEIGIVGTAAAIANAVHHATAIRVRDLPIRPDKLIARDRRHDLSAARTATTTTR
jgi:xanthine dehydrogenase YagR molybdenum-binding subunit